MIKPICTQPIAEFAIGARQFSIQQDPENAKYIWVNEDTGGSCATVLQFYKSADDLWKVEDEKYNLGYFRRKGAVGAIPDWEISELPNMTRRVVSHGSVIDAMTAVALHFLNN